MVAAGFEAEEVFLLCDMLFGCLRRGPDQGNRELGAGGSDEVDLVESLAFAVAAGVAFAGYLQEVLAAINTDEDERR